MLTARSLTSTLLVAVLSVAGITSVGVSSASALTTPSIVETTVDNVIYRADTRAPGLGATVSGWTFFSGDSKRAVVRSRVTIKGVSYPVTTVGKFAFYEAWRFSGFSLPNTITSISAYAFKGVSAQGLVIPNSVTDIGDYAFADSNFPNPALGTGLKTIGKYAFTYANVQSLTIPNSVTSIGEGAFQSSNVTSLTLGKSLTSIGSRAFSFNYGLTSVVIPDSVTTIEFEAFKNSELSSVTLGSGLQTIEWGTFRDARLTSIVIPNSVKSIGEQAFMGNRLASVTLGNSVESIGASAFKYNGIASLVIPDSVTVIGNQAFAGNSMSTLKLGSSLETIGAFAFAYNDLSGDLVMPPSVSTIGSGAFSGAGVFDSVVLPDGLTEISDQAFAYDGVKQVNIPDSVTTIGDRAFSGSDLTSLTLPPALVSIGDYAFESADLTNLTLPSSLVTIGAGAFSGVPLTSIAIPDSVTTIGKRAFLYSPITSLTLGKSVTTIGEEAFYGHGVSRLNVPDSVTRIEARAFASGNYLTEVLMSRSISFLGDNAVTSNQANLAVRMLGTTPPASIVAAGVPARSFQAGGTVQVSYPKTTPDNYGSTWQGYVSQAVVGIFYDSNGHGDNPTSEISTGVSIAAVGQADPSAGQFPFQGWYTQRVGGTRVTFPATITSLTTLYAQWGSSFDTSATPTIQGVAKVGETLTAHAGTWSPEPTLTYEWRRSGSATVIGTGESYVVTPDDFGLTLTVTVTATASGYQTQVVTSAPTVAVAAAAFSVTPTPTIVGTAAVGKLLRASVGEWAEPAAFTYVWKTTSATNVTTTVGTGETYTVAGQDLGKRVSLTVTATLSGYVTTSKVSSLTTAVATGTFASAPTPTISGTAQFGQTLTAVTGTWSNSATLTYQWKRSGSATVLGTAARYTVGVADVGATLTVTVTGTQTGMLTTSKTSVATSTVILATYSTTPTPTISGVPQVGKTLTAVTGTWSNAPTFTYQWRRSGSTSVIGTAATYSVAAADMGTTITVSVIATKPGFATTTKTSTATIAVAVGLFETTPPPTISGSATFGQTLTAVTGTWSNSPTFTYEWRRSGSAAVIGTASTYSVAAADIGTALTVTVIGSQSGFTSVPKVSDATATVVSAAFDTAPNPTISGTTTVDQTLTASTTGWVPSTGVTFTYVWKRADTSGGAGTTIGTNLSTYKLVAADRGKFITVTVTAAKTGYTSTTRTSSPTAAIG